MTTNPGLPERLREASVLTSLRAAGECAARSQTTDRGLIEDAGMHGLEALFSAVLRPDPPESGAWSAYVRTAARRYAQEHDRRAKRNQPGGFGGSMLPRGRGRDGRARVDDALLRGQGSPSLESEVADKVDAEKVGVLIEDLSPMDRYVLRAKYVDGRSTREIAQTTELSEKAVERRLAKAKKSLRQDL